MREADLTENNVNAIQNSCVITNLNLFGSALLVASLGRPWEWWVDVCVCVEKMGDGEGGRGDNLICEFFCICDFLSFFIPL